MGKDRGTPEEAAASFGVGRIRRHLFVCGGPDCCRTDDGDETWDFVKRRMKDLGLTGPDGPAYRTKVKCLRICTEGPIALVYPEGTWYRHVTPENADRIIDEHIGRGRIVSDLCFATNPLFPSDDGPSKI